MTGAGSAAGPMVAVAALAAVTWAAHPAEGSPGWMLALFLGSLALAAATVILPRLALWGASVLALLVQGALHFGAAVDLAWREGFVFSAGIVLYAETTHLRIRVATWRRAAGGRREVASTPILAAIVVWVGVALALAGGIVAAYYAAVYAVMPAVLSESVEVGLAWPLSVCLLAGTLGVWLVRSPWRFRSRRVEADADDEETESKGTREVSGADGLAGGV